MEQNELKKLQYDKLDFTNNVGKVWEEFGSYYYVAKAIGNNKSLKQQLHDLQKSGEVEFFETLGYHPEIGLQSKIEKWHTDGRPNGIIYILLSIPVEDLNSEPTEEFDFQSPKPAEPIKHVEKKVKSPYSTTSESFILTPSIIEVLKEQKNNFTRSIVDLSPCLEQQLNNLSSVEELYDIISSLDISKVSQIALANLINNLPENAFPDDVKCLLDKLPEIALCPNPEEELRLIIQQLSVPSFWFPKFPMLSDFFADFRKNIEKLFTSLVILAIYSILKELLKHVKCSGNDIEVMINCPEANIYSDVKYGAVDLLDKIKNNNPAFTLEQLLESKIQQNQYDFSQGDYQKVINSISKNLSPSELTLLINGLITDDLANFINDLLFNLELDLNSSDAVEMFGVLKNDVGTIHTDELDLCEQIITEEEVENLKNKGLSSDEAQLLVNDSVERRLNKISAICELLEKQVSDIDKSLIKIEPPQEIIDGLTTTLNIVFDSIDIIYKKETSTKLWEIFKNPFSDASLAFALQTSLHKLLPTDLAGKIQKLLEPTNFGVSYLENTNNSFYEEYVGNFNNESDSIKLNYNSKSVGFQIKNNTVFSNLKTIELDDDLILAPLEYENQSKPFIESLKNMDRRLIFNKFLKRILKKNGAPENYINAVNNISLLKSEEFTEKLLKKSRTNVYNLAAEEFIYEEFFKTIDSPNKLKRNRIIFEDLLEIPDIKKEIIENVKKKISSVGEDIAKSFNAEIIDGVLLVAAKIIVLNSLAHIIHLITSSDYDIQAIKSFYIEFVLRQLKSKIYSNLEDTKEKISISVNKLIDKLFSLETKSLIKKIIEDLTLDPIDVPAEVQNTQIRIFDNQNFIPFFVERAYKISLYEISNLTKAQENFINNVDGKYLNITVLKLLVAALSDQEFDELVKNISIVARLCYLPDVSFPTNELEALANDMKSYWIRERDGDFQTDLYPIPIAEGEISIALTREHVFGNHLENQNYFNMAKKNLINNPDFELLFKIIMPLPGIQTAIFLEQLSKNYLNKEVITKREILFGLSNTLHSVENALEAQI